MTKVVLRSALLACFVHAGSVFFASSASAQNTSELGLGLGGLTYKGELSPNYQFKNNRPAFTVFYRKDVSAPITLRGALLGGLLRADDANVKGEGGINPPLPAYRQANMKGSLLELSGAIEYNFFDYHNRRDKVHFTPYVFVGIAGFYANTTTATTNGALATELNKSGNMLGISIPAGIGFKYALSSRWNLGLEVGARKAFTDNLDHISKQSPLIANSHDQDWYFYNGVSISYTFYKIRCPEGTPKEKK